MKFRITFLLEHPDFLGLARQDTAPLWLCYRASQVDQALERLSKANLAASRVLGSPL